MNKSLNIVKKFMKMLRIMLTDRIFFVVRGNFQVWSNYLLVF